MKTKTYPVAIAIAKSALEAANAQEGQTLEIYCHSAEHIEQADKSAWYFTYAVHHYEAEGFKRALGISRGTIRIVVEHATMQAAGQPFIARAA